MRTRRKVLVSNVAGAVSGLIIVAAALLLVVALGYGLAALLGMFIYVVIRFAR